ncbi:MAG: NADH-quinone oxidoreductase subunit J [Thermoleophilaceae bacterium]|nr:NADH-quinone oxidoreductase subunit J [Thermoleophilaceae bacterium]
MLFEQILFFLAAIAALAGALGVVILRNPFYSVLALASHLIALAVLFLLLRAEFIAAAQIVVYAGAVMVLYLFVVAYVGGIDEPPKGEAGAAATQLAPVFGAAIAIEITIAVVGTGLAAIDTQGAKLESGFGSPGQIGEQLLTKFLIPFEAASFLLLVAAVGAVVLARRRRGLEHLDEPGSEPGPDSRPAMEGHA